MYDEEINYKLRILYNIEISKHRIDDQMIPENQEWCLYVFDRNAEKWVPTYSLNHEGENSVIELIQIIKD